LIKILDL